MYCSWNKGAPMVVEIDAESMEDTIGSHLLLIAAVVIGYI